MKSLTLIWVDEYEMDWGSGWRIGIDGICRCNPKSTVLEAIEDCLSRVPPDVTPGSLPDTSVMTALAQLFKAYGGLSP